MTSWSTKRPLAAPSDLFHIWLCSSSPDGRTMKRSRELLSSERVLRRLPRWVIRTLRYAESFALTSLSSSRRAWAKFVLGIDNFTALLDMAIVSLLFLWLFDLTFFLFQDYGLVPIPQGSSLFLSFEGLVSFANFLLYSVFATLLISFILIGVLRHYRRIPIVRYARLAALRRWQFLSLGIVLMGAIGLVISYLSSTGQISASTTTLSYDYLEGSALPFVDWVILFVAAYVVESPDPVYGQLGYLELLSLSATEIELIRPSRIRIILLGSYRTVSRALRRQIVGLRDIDLDKFFTNLQLGLTARTTVARPLVSQFASKTLTILKGKDPQERKGGRILDLIDQTNFALSDRGSGSIKSSIVINWPGRFRKTNSVRAGTIQLLVELVVAIIIAFLRLKA
jgi:hypothetical protein